MSHSACVVMLLHLVDSGYYEPTFTLGLVFLRTCIVDQHISL